jgi:hypothetical protein
VAAACYVPPTRPLGNVRFSIEGHATSTEAQTALASAVSASVFKLLGIPLVRGRLIEERDLQNAPTVAVISATLSRRYWPNENPIGQNTRQPFAEQGDRRASGHDPNRHGTV